jgi:hypothetical protein
VLRASSAESPTHKTNADGSLQSTSDTILYADDFDYTKKTVPVIGAAGQAIGTESYVTSRGGSQSVMPRFLRDRNGAFEAYLPSGSTNYVLRQQVDQPSMGLGGTWNDGAPITGVGENRWLNYKASVDARGSRKRVLPDALRQSRSKTAAPKAATTTRLSAPVSRAEPTPTPSAVPLTC